MEAVCYVEHAPTEADRLWVTQEISVFSEAPSLLSGSQERATGSYPEPD
jgi:hypothetical protein